MSIIESLIPNPVSISPVHPAIPTIVIIALFLYLKIFLIVTFLEKFSLLHMNVIFSKNIFLPFLGALGLISAAGVSFNSECATNIVAPPMHANAINVPARPIPN